MNWHMHTRDIKNVAFICSCFGALRRSALRYLTVLAMLELRQHETVTVYRVWVHWMIVNVLNIGRIVSGLALLKLLLVWQRLPLCN